MIKKLLGIVFLGLLLGGLTTPVAYTKEKKIKIKVRMQDSAAIVFVRFAGGKEEKKKRATVLMNEMAKSHCSSYNKEAYVFKSHGAYDQDALHKAIPGQDHRTPSGWPLVRRSASSDEQVIHTDAGS